MFAELFTFRWYAYGTFCDRVLTNVANWVRFDLLFCEFHSLSLERRSLDVVTECGQLDQLVICDCESGIDRDSVWAYEPVVILFHEKGL